MAKNQNTIEKRRREIEKKRKAHEKRERRRKKKEEVTEPTNVPAADTDQDVMPEPSVTNEAQTP